MVSYSTMALNGRIAAAATAHQPHRAITEYRWTEAPTMVGRWHDPAPPFTTERTYRQEQVGTHWEVEAILSCGHRASWLAYGVTGHGHVPARWGYAYPVGKKKRCTECPPVEPKPAPPDEVRCEGEDGGEEAGWRRCRTRARWQVWHESPGGERTKADRLCERHRRRGIEWGGIMPDPLPYPHGYTDGGWDIVEAFVPPK